MERIKANRERQTENDMRWTINKLKRPRERLQAFLVPAGGSVRSYSLLCSHALDEGFRDGKKGGGFIAIAYLFTYSQRSSVVWGCHRHSYDLPGTSRTYLLTIDSVSSPD